MEKVCDENKCTGCGLCEVKCPKGAIIMSYKNGFKYPKIDQNLCVNCNLCINNCPINNQLNFNSITNAFLAYSLDTNIRTMSSSGGIFYELASNILKNRGVVIGAAYITPYKVEHIIVDKENDLSKLITSKYVQSDIHNVLVQIDNHMKNNQFILFVGTPCQVSAVKKKTKNYNNILLVDFVCHSIPSPIIYEKYIKCLEESKCSKVEKVNFRSKHTGWNRKNFSMKIDFKNGETLCEIARNNSYFRAFVYNVINRSSCYSCKFKGITRESDITLADFWGIWELYPEINTQDGASLLMIHSEKGNRLIRKISSSLYIKQVDINNVIKYNEAIIKQCKPSHKKKRYFNKLLKCKNEEVEKLLMKSTKFSIFDKLIIKIRG